MYGHPVEIVQEEGAAYGAAVLAAVGAGWWPSVDAACHQVIRTRARIEPHPESALAMNNNYEMYRRIYAATRSILLG